MATKKAAKKAPAKKAAKKAAKKVAKKAAKKVAVVARKSAVFTLAAKVKVEDLGATQRGAIAKVLRKTGGATRAMLIEALPDVPPANISWYLTKMASDKLVKKTAQ